MLSARAEAQTWPTHSEIGPALQAYETAYPSLCKRYDLGSSVQGRSLWAIKISDNVNVEEDEPECKYIAAMHGDEIVGTKMCLNLVDYLLTNYGVDPQATDLVDQLEIWIVPLMNPDGYSASPRTRYNATGIDLNRNFPDPFTSPNNTPAGRAPEVGAIMNWSFAHSFTLAANFHGGALVVNYPYDNNASGSSVYTASPDDDLFIDISETYSAQNPPMWNSASFFHGITNGADWYAISGGMQDWDYRYLGGNEVTIELGETKQPSASQIPTLWNNNRAAMLAYLETSLIGVRGIVTDWQTAAPLYAMIDVVGRDQPVYSDPDVGDYHRMLLPGVYDVRVTATAHDSVTMTGLPVLSGPATRRDLALGPPTQVVFPDGGETLYAGQPATVSWTGHTGTAFQVQYTSNYGASDNVTDGFETGVFDPAYTSGGSANWQITGAAVHGGTKAAQAGTISHNQQTWLQRTVEGGAISFWYRVGSEANWDYFNFYIDGVRQIHASGSVGWTLYTIVLSAGSHTLKWEYTKDGSVSTPPDTCYIDDLQFTQDATAWNEIIAMTPVGAASTGWTPSVVGTSYKVRSRAVYAADMTGEWDESNALFAVESVPCTRGDLDDSGGIDGLDLQLFVNAVLSTPTADEICRGDFDSSGTLDENDVGGMVDAALTGGP